MAAPILSSTEYYEQMKHPVSSHKVKFINLVYLVGITMLILAVFIIYKTRRVSPSSTPPTAETQNLVATANIYQQLPQQSGETYYIRTDGGSAEQCTGLENVPYPGVGVEQPCAWNHPFQAFPPGGVARISSGDTLIIMVGSYQMGYGAPGTDDSEVCSPDGPWGCYMAPIPSGPDASHPTRILGEGWNTGCIAQPELWGTERADIVINLTDASNVEVACLEITDRSDCIEYHSGGLACNRDQYPFGTWAVIGLYAEDSINVHLWNLNIHGFASGGVHAGRLQDWFVEDVRIAGNGWVGWDGDLWQGDDSNAGTIHFLRVLIEWNGCGETYPGGQPIGCWGQEAGGYGDGLGTGLTSGHWLIEDSAFMHNTSDGLDLLYARIYGSVIEIKRTIAEGNAGNQIKTSGQALIENSIVVGNCGFFEEKPFNFWVDHCRAAGNSISVDILPETSVTIFNSTITGEGDCLLLAVCGDEQGGCDGSELVLARNNIFLGWKDFLQPFENTCLAWSEGFPTNPFDLDYSLIYSTKDNPPCPGEHDICGVPPGLVNPTRNDFDGNLVSGSPAIDAGTPLGAPIDDFSGHMRDGHPDIGAYEWWQPGWVLYLPVIN